MAIVCLRQGETQEQPPKHFRYIQSALRVVSTLTYLGFVTAYILNSWFPIKKNVYLIHAIQPCLTLCFCAALSVWWKRQLLNGDLLSLGAAWLRLFFQVGAERRLTDSKTRIG